MFNSNTFDSHLKGGFWGFQDNSLFENCVLKSKTLSTYTNVIYLEISVRICFYIIHYNSVTLTSFIELAYVHTIERNVLITCIVVAKRVNNINFCQSLYNLVIQPLSWRQSSKGRFPNLSYRTLEIVIFTIMIS